MCMCRSTSISGREASLARIRRSPRRVVPARDERRVDRLELVGDPRPGERRAQLARRASRRRPISSGVGDQPCAGARRASRRRRARTRARTRPREQELLVGRRAARRPAPRPPPSARISVPGAGRMPSEASTAMSAPASTSASLASGASDEPDPLAQRRARAWPAASAGARTRPSPRQSSSSGSERSARRNDPQGRALLVGDEHHLDELRARCRARRGIGAREDDLVVGRERSAASGRAWRA